MILPFKIEILLAWLKLHLERLSYERDPKKHQKKMWQKFQTKILSHSPLYKSKASFSLEDFPIQEKKEFMENFNEINTKGLDIKDAFSIATGAEKSRDFSSKINGLTVGLSTGTSGNKGLFVISDKERAMWVAIVLQRIIGWKFSKRKISFFLRANSNLYSAVQSKFIAFHFFDLLIPLENHLNRINKLQPNIIVGQPSLLKLLAEAQVKGIIKLKPSKIISVAEVLSKKDQDYLEIIFQIKVQQVYQCSEGILAQTCEKGNLHLNEDGIIVEKQWIDDSRFIPIITDLRRSTQPILRYRMNDILHPTICSCGSKMQALSKIEGRMDDVLEFNGAKRIFPDFIRRAIINANSAIDNYQVIRISKKKLNLFISPEKYWNQGKDALKSVLKTHEIENIDIVRIKNKNHERGTKFRRIHAKYK